MPTFGEHAAGVDGITMGWWTFSNHCYGEVSTFLASFFIQTPSCPQLCYCTVHHQHGSEEEQESDRELTGQDPALIKQKKKPPTKRRKWDENGVGEDEVSEVVTPDIPVTDDDLPVATDKAN